MILRRLIIGLGCAAAFAGLAGCDPPLHEQRIAGRYHLLAPRYWEELAICYETEPYVCETRVEGTVFAYGVDKDFIVAARHPVREIYVPADRTTTEYYYIIRAYDGPNAGPHAVRGPFTPEEFKTEQARYPLPPLDHDLTGQIHWVNPPPQSQPSTDARAPTSSPPNPAARP
jgi:hypothetical protein